MRKMSYGYRSRRLRALSVSLTALALPACTNFQAMSRVDPQTVAYYYPGKTDPLPDPAASGPAQPQRCPILIGTDARSGAINLDCFRFPEDSGEFEENSSPNPPLRKNGDTATVNGKHDVTDNKRVSTQPRTAYQKVIAAEGSAQITLRNRLIAVLIKHSDDICTVEMGRLVGDEATAKTTLTTLDSIFSTASTIVTGTQAKSILSGAAGVMNTTRSTVSAEIYRNSLTSAITRAIMTERIRLRGLIEQKLGQTFGAYTIDQAIVDVNEYHQTCSLYHGLELVNDAVDSTRAPATAAKAALDAISFLDAQIALVRNKRNSVDNRAATHDAEVAEYERQIEALENKKLDMITKRADMISGTPPTPAPSQATQ